MVIRRASIVAWAVVALTLAGAPAAAEDKADAAYREAKESYQRLKGDAARRKLRHHWQNVAARFEKVAAKHPKSDRAPEALFTAAQLYQELSRFSQLAEDLASSVKLYERLIDGWPRHRLADDGAFALGRIRADRMGDVAGARKALKLAAQGGGDMAGDARKLLAALPQEVAPRTAQPPAREAKERAPKEKETKGPEPKEAVAAKEPAPERKAAEPQKRKEAPERQAAADAVEAPARTAAQAEAEDPDQAKPQDRKALSDAVAEAIRRVARPADPAELETRQARRVAPERPRVEPEADGDEGEAAPDETEEHGGRVLDSLAERLRDVRVGQADDEARARLKRVSRDEKASELTLAEQLGLKVRRVVIDAGHGGHDTGAIGPSGVREKDVALAIALKLKDRLEKSGLEVLLTRDDDTFVKLEERTHFANARKGDLFISIHCNAAPSRKMRGVETYTLNTSSDRYAIRLAARENASTERGVSDLQFILADLATKANTEESTRLADKVQKTLVKSLRAGRHKTLKDLGTKEALFFVLLGAKMPAILVETAFLSNAEEEKLLGSAAYQDDTAQAIADAVQSFLDERSRLARVD